MMNAIRFLALLLTLALLQAPEAQAQTKLRFGYTAANDLLPAFVAKDQGFFERNGLDVELQLVPNGSVTPAALAAGSLHIATPTAPIFLQANENGIDLVVVSGASLFTSQNRTIGLVSPVPGLKSAADLAGRKVSVPGINGVMHVVFMKWLKQSGVDPAKVTYIETGFAQMPDMLRGKQVDAAIVLEPFLSRILDAKVAQLVSPYFYEVREQGLFTMYVASRKWAQENPAAVAAFRRSLEQALDFIKSNRDAARQSEARYLKLPPEVVARMPLATFTTQAPVPEMEFWRDLSQEFGLLRRKVDVRPLVLP